MITASEITAVVRRLPEVATSSLTLTRGAVTAQDFVRWPFVRTEMPDLRIIQNAVEAGRR